MTRLVALVFAFLLLPVLALAQPAKTVAPAKAVVVAVAKAPAPVATQPEKAKVVVAPASQPASAPVVVSAPAQAQAAPASQPAVKAAWKVWLADNWLWLLIAVIIPSLINGLKKKGVREGIIGFLESLLDRISVATNKNTVGTFKAPIVRSGPPVETPKK